MLSTPMTTLNNRLQLALLNRKKGKNALEKGFTLVELMIVIVIVGVLSAVALPNFLSQTNKARASEAQAQISAAFKNATAVYLANPSASTDIAGGSTTINATTIAALSSGVGTCGTELKLNTSNAVTAYECLYDTGTNVLSIGGKIEGGGTVIGTVNLQTGVVTTAPTYSG